MKLPDAPEKYDRSNEQRAREMLRLSDAENLKRGRDVLLEQGERIITRSPNGNRWVLSVSNAGALVITAL